MVVLKAEAAVSRRQALVKGGPERAAHGGQRPRHGNASCFHTGGGWEAATHVLESGL